MERELRPELKNEQPINLKQEAAQEEVRGGQKFEGANATNVPAVDEEKKPAAPEEENVAELKEKIQMVVDYRFGGSYKAAFQHYGMSDDKIDMRMLTQLLTAAGVSQKGKWVKTIMTKVDTIDGHIPYTDFETFVTSRWA